MVETSSGWLRLHAFPGAEPPPSLNERAGYVLPAAPGAAPAATLALRAAPGGDPAGEGLVRELCDADGRVLARLEISPRAGGGFRLVGDESGAGEAEGWYGLGFQRRRLELHGQRLTWARRYRHDEATVPFFFSTRGYGVFSNNPRDQTFDFTRGESWSVEATEGVLDVFLIAGPTPAAILDHYTRLCGRPGLPPRWALDPLYIARYFETQAGLLEIARTFRERDIPCGMLGLEPGWEQNPYSMEWRWCPDRFPEPRHMIEELHALGYRFELWESGLSPETGHTDAARRREWFAKRTAASVALGVDFFKQDDPYPRMIHSEEMEAAVLRERAEVGPEDREAANIANSLYSETVCSEMERLTGRRALVLFNSYFASVAAHRWPTAWAADFPSGCGLLSASLSGHAMVSLDMEVHTLRGIHYGYLTPFTVNDSWAYYDEPWLYPPHIEGAHRHYAKLRLRLGPYLYSALWQARLTGRPLMRPMALEHPRDLEVRNLTTQHLLGDALLVGQEARVYLPAGRWIDYWTGASRLSKGEWVECAWAEPAGGPLWVRGGSILVTRPVCAFAGAEPESVLVVECFPDAARAGTALLHEDDGESPLRDAGTPTTTRFDCRIAGDELVLTVGAASGSDVSSPRGFLFRVLLERAPADLRWAGELLPRAASVAELTKGLGARGWAFDADARTLWVKPDAAWRFGADARGAGDPEQDTPFWTGRPARPEGELRVSLGDALPAAVATLTGDEPKSPVELGLVLNPPERIALKGSGDWLPTLVDVHGWLRDAGGATVPLEGRPVRLRTLGPKGEVIKEQTTETKAGRVLFEKQPYVPGETRFELSAPGLGVVEATVRATPPVPGRIG